MPELTSKGLKPVTNHPAWMYDIPENAIKVRAEREGLDWNDPWVHDSMWFAILIERLRAHENAQWQHPVFTRDSTRLNQERGARIGKRIDLREQVVRLARLARLGRKVTHESLAGKTEHQLRLMVEELKAIRVGQLEREAERMTPEQRASELSRLQERKRRRETHEAGQARARSGDYVRRAVSVSEGDSPSSRSVD